jgi:DNA-binding IclR family transcriptional regulator
MRAPNSPVTGAGALREERPRDLLSSVARALEVLELVVGAREPLPVKVVASRLGMSLGTAYHVLHTLEHGGYVVRVGRGRYGLGGKVSELSRLFLDGVDLVPVVRPHMRELSVMAAEDTYLAVMRGGEILVAEVIEGATNLHCGDLGIGFSRVAHSTAVGKVLLAAMPDGDVDHYLGERRLSRRTAQTLIERRHVKRHLRAVRELGVARDLEEFAEGVFCVAFPIVDASGTIVASIGLSVPTRRWRSEQDRLIRLCSATAIRTSADLGMPVEPSTSSAPAAAGFASRARSAQPNSRTQAGPRIPGRAAGAHPPDAVSTTSSARGDGQQLANRLSSS